MFGFHVIDRDAIYFARFVLEDAVSTGRLALAMKQSSTEVAPGNDVSKSGGQEWQAPPGPLPVTLRVPGRQGRWLP